MVSVKAPAAASLERRFSSSRATRVIAAATPRLHGVKLHPLEGVQCDVIRRKGVASFEHGKKMRRRQLAIQQPHLEVVEIFGARGAENREAHLVARPAVRIPGARRDDAGDAGVGERNPHRHTRSARHAGQVDALEIDGEPAAHVGAHRLCRRRRDRVRAVPGVVGRRDDVAILLRGRLVFLGHEPSPRRRVERQEQTPSAVGRIGGWQEERVRLRRIVGALDRVHDGSARQGLRRRARRPQTRNHHDYRE